jgi:hypothetical protein
MEFFMIILRIKRNLLPNSFSSFHNRDTSKQVECQFGKNKSSKTRFSERHGGMEAYRMAVQPFDSRQPNLARSIDAEIARRLMNLFGYGRGQEEEPERAQPE